MPQPAPIFNYHEKDLLLHVLFENYPKARKKIKELILVFEQTDFNKPCNGKTSNPTKRLIDLFLEDKEDEFEPLGDYYHGMGFGLAGYSLEENIVLEAGVFYMIAKLLLVNYHHRKGLNKLRYASSLEKLPDKFKPLFYFRIGSIYLEQGMMPEASDTLALARYCCWKYKTDPNLLNLEELILYQILRVFVIREEYDNAQNIIDALKKMVKEKNNIIFLCLQGYFYRRRQKTNKAFKILNKSYALYKDNSEVKRKFPRRWFDNLYQLSFCYLQSGQIAKAEVYAQKALDTIKGQSTRNLSYCNLLFGQIEMKKKGGELKTALKYFDEAFQIFEQYNDYRNMARSTRSIGGVYFELQDFFMAGKFYNQALVYDYRTQISGDILRSLYAKAKLRIELFQYYKVEEYLNRIDKLGVSKEHYLLPKVNELKKTLKGKRTPSKNIMGSSQTIKKVNENALTYSKLTDPILILGESGVGKSMIAGIMHKDSGLSGQFVHVYCTSITPTLVESELFGYVDKAFTGAGETRTGLFDEADGGTLFLDEIGDISLELQGKLLRFFDKKTIRRVGGKKFIKLDIKIICATNKDLKKEVAKGNFREDLFYRINSLSLIIPPLRERPEDIKDLAENFYAKSCHKQKKEPGGLSENSLNYIKNYPWPGNARELESVINRSIINLNDKEMLTKKCLKKAIDIIEHSSIKKPQEIIQGDISKTSDSYDNLLILINDLKKRVETLESQQGISGARISDKKKALNDLFLFIQHAHPARKSQIIENLPHLERSFKHWIDLLVEKYQVIEIDKSGRYHQYKPMSDSNFKSKEKEGVIIRNEEGYYQLA